jgi:hypothetical protein
MRKSNRWLTTFYSLLLAAGLFCAQVCQLVCATTACAAEAQAVQPKPQLAHSHCHQTSQSASQPSAETPSESLPSAPSPTHDCQKHTILQSLPPNNQVVKAGVPADWQAQAQTPLLVADFARAPTAIRPLSAALFRPPPRSWLTTIQRI